MHVRFLRPSSGGRSAVIPFWFPSEAMDTLPSILENPLQKQFWGVSAFPYYIFLIYFYVRSSIFVM